MSRLACIALALCLAGPAAGFEGSLDLSISHGTGSSGHGEYADYDRATYGAGVTFHFGSPDFVVNGVLSLGYRHGRIWGDTGNGWERLDERYDNVLVGNTLALGNRWIRVGPAFHVGGATTLELGYGLSLLARVPREHGPDIGVAFGWSRMSEVDIIGDGRDTNEFGLTASLRWGRAPGP